MSVINKNYSFMYLSNEGNVKLIELLENSKCILIAQNC